MQLRIYEVTLSKIVDAKSSVDNSHPHGKGTAEVKPDLQGLNLTTMTILFANVKSIQFNICAKCWL